MLGHASYVRNALSGSVQTSYAQEYRRNVKQKHFQNVSTSWHSRRRGPHTLGFGTPSTSLHGWFGRPSKPRLDTTGHPAQILDDAGEGGFPFEQSSRLFMIVTIRIRILVNGLSLQMIIVPPQWISLYASCGLPLLLVVSNCFSWYQTFSRNFGAKSLFSHF